MSFLGKIMDTMRLNDDEDDDYFLDDDYEDEKPARKNLFKKQTADDLDDYEEEKPRFLPPTNSNKVVPMRRGSGMEVSLIKPTSLDDAKEICDYLLAGKAVVLNMEGIHTETAQRIIDFTSGSTYSMNGNLQKISKFNIHTLALLLQEISFPFLSFTLGPESSFLFSFSVSLPVFVIDLYFPVFSFFVNPHC